MCQLVAFKSLIVRNENEFQLSSVNSIKNVTADDTDDIKLKLPFIVVNTSKETVVDCWLSPDRFFVSVCLSYN